MPRFHPVRVLSREEVDGLRRAFIDDDGASDAPDPDAPMVRLIVSMEALWEENDRLAKRIGLC